MTTLLHFEEKVHRKDLARAEAIPLLMPRLLGQVLEHLGFPEEPLIERRLSCPLVCPSSSLYIYNSLLFYSSSRRSWMIMKRTCRGVSSLFQRWRWRGTSVPDLSPQVPPSIAPTLLETACPSSTSQEPLEQIPGTSRDFLAI